MKKIFIAIFSFALLFLVGCKINFETAESKLIFVEEESIELEVGDEYLVQLRYEGVEIEWEYDNTIISIADSKVTALKVGKTTVVIKEKGGDLSVSFDVEVKAKKEETPVDKKVASINIEGNINMAVDDTQTLKVTVMPEDATNKELEFKSSNNSVAVVSETGFVTALSSGLATITVSAKDGSGVTATIKITVSGKLVSSINIEGNKEVKVGKTIKLTANILPEDAEDLNITWSSSNEEVATVDKGTVSGLATGKVVIRATANDGSGVFGEIEITVVEDNGPFEPTGIILVVNGKEYNDKETVNLEVGETYPFEFKYLPADKEVLEGIDASLYDEKYCKVENDSFVTTAIGRVAFQAFALYGDCEAMFVINVTEKYYAPTEIVISTDALYVEVGVSAQFSASILPAEAHQNVVWSTNDESIATIDENGLLTGVSVGTVKVIAVPADGEDLKQEYEIEVKENTSVDKQFILVDPSYTATGSTVTVEGKEFTIGKNAFDSLGKAIEEAVNGTNIIVFPGEYAQDKATLSVDNVTVYGPNQNVNPVINHDRSNEAKVATAITVTDGVKNFTVKGLYLYETFNIKLLGNNENIEASFNYIYATTADGIITFADSKKSVKGLKANFNYSPKYVAYRFVYAWNVEDVEIIGNELWGNNEIQYVCDILNCQGVISGKVVIRDNRFDNLYQSVCYCKGVGVIDLLFQNNYVSNVYCTIIDFRDMNASGSNKFNVLYNTFETVGRFVSGNTSQADWGMIRISTAGYKDTDEIEINVNYNIFDNAESDDNGLFVAWNRGKSSSLEKFVKIVNYDNNYFNGKTANDWPADYFGLTDASVNNTYTNKDDVPRTEPLDYRLLTAEKTIVVNKYNTQDATDEFPQYYGLCMFDSATAAGATLYWQKVSFKLSEGDVYEVVEVKAAGESLSEAYDYYILMFADGSGNENILVEMNFEVGEKVIFSVDPSTLTTGACELTIAVIE